MPLGETSQKFFHLGVMVSKHAAKVFCIWKKRKKSWTDSWDESNKGFVFVNVLAFLVLAILSYLFLHFIFWPLNCRWSWKSNCWISWNGPSQLVKRNLLHSFLKKSKCPRIFQGYHGFCIIKCIENGDSCSKVFQMNHRLEPRIPETHKPVSLSHYINQATK